jgi:phosphoglycolate phosphatase
MTGVVFDLDGTLVDSLPDVTSAINRAFRTAGLPPVTVEQVEPAMGHGARQLVAAAAGAAAPDAPLAATDLDEVCASYQREYAEVPAAQTAPFADAVDAVRSLHERGVRVGICTNKTTDLARQVLAAVGLADYVTSVIGRDGSSNPKPDPRHLLDVVASLGLEPGEVVYVGDNPIDVAVARGAGIAYRHVAWGVPVDGVQVLHHFADLVELLLTDDRPSSASTSR